MNNGVLRKVYITPFKIFPDLRYKNLFVKANLKWGSAVFLHKNSTSTRQRKRYVVCYKHNKGRECFDGLTVELTSELRVMLQNMP
jgi:hypothetical protein